MLSEGYVVEVRLAVELLHDFQVSLKCFDLGGQVVGHFLDRFVTREEVEYLIDIPAKYVSAAEFVDQLDFELVPVGDVVEGALLVEGKGLQGEHQLDRVGASG